MQSVSVDYEGRFRGTWFRFVQALVFTTMLVAIGCGPKETSVDACLDVICDRGVCNDATGTCGNASQCIDTGECLVGYNCAAGACVPNVTCGENGECDAGVCVNGACVNPSSCSVRGDCVDGYFCAADSTCQIDQCADVTCERGACNSNTGECVNAGVCNRATEATDCLEDHRCIDNGCISYEAICAALGCEAGRGVCDPVANACVNAPSCGGDDGQCLAGFFCNDDDACQVNACIPDTDRCDRGACDRETGECANTPDCTASVECLDDHYCVGGECQETGPACEACEGNKGCSYDEDSLAIVCTENPDGCARTVDCNDERVCRDGECSEPTACEPDGYEPNDDFDSATVARPILNNGLIRANICDGDVDFFELSTTGYGLVRGKYIVELSIRSEDVGAGSLELVIFNQAQTEVARGATDENGRVSLDFNVTPSNLGTYYARIEQIADVSVAGVRYAFFADFVADAVINACGGAASLVPGTSEGNTTEGATNILQNSCAPANGSAENLYAITIDQRSVATFELTPPAESTNVNLAMSLRRNCLSAFSELACANEHDDNRAESMRLTLDPGEYTLLVKGATASSGGAYTLDFGLQPVVCWPGNGQCVSESESTICNADGTAFETVTCPDGCNDENGLCIRTEGDVCYAAIDARNGYSGDIRWSEFNNEYEVGPGSCVPDQTQRSYTNGPDVAYRVRLEVGQSLQATLTSPNDFGSLYLVEDCEDPAGRCLAGANQSSQRFDNRYVDRLVYRNDSDDVMNLFVIADSNAAAVVGTSQIEILIGFPICNDSERRCQSDDLQRCSESRLSFDLERPCPFGCDQAPGQNASCAPIENNQCKGAVDIVARGGTYSDLIQLYTNDYNPTFSGCTGMAMTGPDATFYVDADAGDVITAAINAQFDAGIFIVSNCNSIDRTCYIGESNAGLTRETVQFVAPTTGRYYIIAGARQSSASGRFTVTASVDLPMCNPGTLLGCSDDSTLSYCSELGAPTPYACATSCTGSACDLQTGEICHDAVRVFGGESFAVSYQERAEATIEPGEVGNCFFDEDNAPAGADAYYRVSLKAGDTLVASGSGYADQFGSSYPIVFYMLETCGQLDSCLLNTQASTTPRLVYTAQVDEEFILVAAAVSRTTINQSFDVNIDIFQAECAPNTQSCISDTELTFCNQLRALETFTCMGGCEQDACQTPQGDNCGDGIPLEHLQPLVGNYLGTNQVTGPAGRYGECTFTRFGFPEGPDTIYTVALEAGDRLEVFKSSPNLGTQLYILETCTDLTSCVAKLPGDFHFTHRLHYEASEARTVYVVADKWGATTLDRPFDIFANIQPAGPDCTAGETTCLDADFLGYCNDKGYFSAYNCDGGCENGACAVPRGGVCADAKPLLSGSNEAGTFQGERTLELQAGTNGTCEVSTVSDFSSDVLHASEGPTNFYEVDMSAGQTLRVEWEGSNTRTMFYVVADCGDPDSCIEKAPYGGSGVLEYTADADGKVFLVAQRKQRAVAGARYAFRAFILEPTERVCDGPSQTCLADGNTVAICGDEGAPELRACPGGCQDGRCTPPTGDFCGDAIELADGESYTGQWSGQRNLYNPGSGEVGECNFGTTTANGSETKFAVDLSINEVLTATLTTTYNNAMLYIVEDCTDTNSCLAYRGSRGEGSVSFPAPRNMRVYVIVDDSTATAPTGTNDAFTLDISIDDPECFVGDTFCGAEENELVYCTSLGVFASHTCAQGCAGGACINPNGDSCQEAIALLPGETVSGGFTGTNTINPSTGESGLCDFAFAGTGNERVYSIDVSPGEVLTARVDSTLSRTMVYILEECGNLDTCQATDVDGVPTTIARYVATQERTVFVVVDRGFTTSTANAFTLTVDVDEPTECILGTQRCSADDAALEYCNEYGVWDRFPCQSGTCLEGFCANGDADTCQDAQEVFAGDTITTTLASASRTKTLEFGGGTFGQCEVSGTVQGRESIYRIDLEAGDLLRAEILSGPTATVLYILQDCFSPDTCLDYDASATGSVVYHQAQQNGPVYVVVDRTNSTSVTTALSVGFDVQKDVCTPGDQVCVDDNTIGFCNRAGYQEELSCMGGCFGGMCSTPGGDFCADAIPLEADVVTTGDWNATKTATFAPGRSISGQCDFDVNVQGRDTFYSIEVNAGEVIFIDFISGFVSGLAYIVEDCLGPESCAVYAGRGSSRLYYEATEDRTIYLVVDTLSTGSSTNEYSIRMSRGYPGECSPGERRCNEDNADYCSSYGIWEYMRCAGGCEDGFCGQPSGDHCGDVIGINGPGTYANEFRDATRSINPGTDTCVVYDGDEPTGQDRVFSVFLQAGEVLRASVSTTHTGTNLYMLDSCLDDAATSCQTYNPRRQDLEFLAGTAGTYYLVVDTSSGHLNVTNTFELEIDIEQTAYTCLPGQTSCPTGSKELMRCVADGGGFAPVATCETSCIHDACGAPAAVYDTCEDAFHVTASVRVFDDLNRFANNFNPGTDGCSGRTTSGGDAVYRVSLNAGQALRAKSYIYGDGTSALYAFTDCGDFDGTCVASDNGTTGIREITYLATQNTDVFVILGAAFASQNDVYYIDFDITDAACTPGESICLTNDSRSVCDESGQFVTQACDFGCESGLCNPPTNNTCEGAVDAGAGIDSTLDIGDFTNTLDLADALGSCINRDTPGQDIFYYVDAARNDVISIRANTNGDFNSAIWITTECGANALDACVGGVDVFSISTPDVIDFVAPEAGRYYIVIDSRFANNSGTVRVQISVESATCQAGAAYCEDGQTLMACRNDGTGYDPYACDGACLDGACVSPRGDICADTVPVSASATFMGNFGQFTNAMDPGFGGCTGFDAPGPDSIFAVSLRAGQTLAAVLSNGFGATTDLSLYLVWDCTDPRGTCLVGSDAYGGVDETIFYTATEDEVVFLVADAWTVDAATDFLLGIDIQ